MVSRARLLFVLGVTFMLALRPSTAHAQLEAFVQAVRQLAEATQQSESLRSMAVRAAASRMGTALAGWDRNIGALEARVAREIPGAPDQRAYELHVQLGVTYRARGRSGDALREFDAAVAIKPSSSDLQVLRALTLESAGRTGEADKAFLNAWNLDVRDPVKAYYVIQRPEASTAERDRARAFLTDTYRRHGADAARPAAPPFVTLDVIADNLSRTPVVADHATAEGFALLIAGQYSDGVAALVRPDREKGEETEGSPLAHFARGRRDEAQNRIAEARRAYQAALTGTLVGRSTLLVGIARLAQVEGDVTGAIDAFTQAAQLNPNDPNIHKELAGRLRRPGPDR